MGPAADLRYHAATLRLLGRAPVVSADAVARIERSEAGCGRRLPAAVREWYTLDGAAGWLTIGDDECGAATLDELLAGFVKGGEVLFYGPQRVNTGYEAYLTFDGTDDPPVRVDGEARQTPFSEYVQALAEYAGSR